MAASTHLKTQPPKPNRRKRRETIISGNNSTPSTPTVTAIASVASTLPVVVSEGPWCCAAAKPYTPTSPPRQPPRRGPVNAPATHPPPPLPDQEPAEPIEPEAVHSPSPVRSGCASSCWVFSPIMDAVPSAPLSTGGAFNTALNPMSPPFDKTRSSPTLLEMMASELDCRPRNPIPLLPPAGSSGITKQQLLQHHHQLSTQERQLLLQERVAEILGSCSPGNQFSDPDSSDVRLILSSKDGISVSMNVHHQILVTHSRFFAAKLSDHRSNQQLSLPHLVEISDCDDVEVYMETLRLMYCNSRLVVAHVGGVHMFVARIFPLYVWGGR